MTVVVYHRNCTDGAAAAYAAWVKYGAMAQYVPYDYSDDFPLEMESLKGQEVFFVDICPTMALLFEVADSASKVFVVDHHESARRRLKENHAAIGAKSNVTMLLSQANDIAGCMMTWNLFHEGVAYPDIIRFTNDYDIYRFQYGDVTREYQAAFEQIDLNDIHEIRLFAERRGRDEVLQQGRLLLNARRKLVENIAATATLVSWEDYLVACCNAPRDLRNEVADELHRQTKVLFSMVYSDIEGKRHYSLRANHPECTDLSKLAEKYGGGGHPRAAGFVDHTGFETIRPAELFAGKRASGSRVKDAILRFKHRLKIW